MLVKYGHLYIYALHVRKSIATCIPVIMLYTCRASSVSIQTKSNSNSQCQGRGGTEL